MNKNMQKYSEYNLKQYIEDIKEIGLEKTWNEICEYVLKKEKNEFLDTKNFGELYEIGLAIEDKIKKKKSGQYYTPDDVALIMSEWLSKCEGENICDVACGTGKLILTYLEYIGEKQAKELLKAGRVYLYDSDKIALKICKTIIIKKYGNDLKNKIHDIRGDFLNKNIVLPNNCKTIANPPYANFKEIKKEWDETEVIEDSHEYYSAFMDKIFKQSESTVIITPYSFISGNKFYSLRQNMCKYGNGFIVNFDNVPGNIFCGRKHGIFNTNTANSVRAAITLLKKSDDKKGFKITPMIRFKNEERNKLLKCKVLEKVLPNEYQIIDEKNKEFKKIDKRLSQIYKSWINNSQYTIKDLVTKDANKFLINMPNTCRYNTTASSKKLARKGSITLNFEEEDAFYFVYCVINSSFAYWWWRIYDGGITYPKGLLEKMPIPLNLLDSKEKEKFKNIAIDMINKESQYKKFKLNAGEKQENIKFPEEYKNKINNMILNILKIKENAEVFDNIHSNNFFNIKNNKK